MIDDKALREVLQRKISQINECPKKIRQEVENIMLNKFNVNYSTTVEIFRGLLPVETLSYDMLYKLTVSIHDMIINNDKAEHIDVSDLYLPKYFTKYEIEEYAKPLKDIDLDIDIVFDKNQWMQVNVDQYVCVVPIETIIQWRNANKIKYNHNTQRELTEKVTKGGVIVKVVTIFDNAIKSIKNLMRKDDFISDDITFNVNPDFYDEPKIKNGKLIVSSSVDIIDGFHRYLSMCDIKDQYPKWNFNCIINLMVFNEEKAQRYMIQKDKKNHLSTKQLVKIDRSESNYVIRRINESSTFHLKGSVDEETLVFLVKLITDLFNPQERQDAVELSKIIEKSINEIIEVNGSYDKILSIHEWFIYLYLLKRCNCNSDTFIDIINKINIETLLAKMKFKNKPTKQSYRIIDMTFREVRGNV